MIGVYELNEYGKSENLEQEPYKILFVVNYAG